MADQEEQRQQLKEYNVTINGIDTTMQLTEADAQRLKATLVDQEARVQSKARTARNKARMTDSEE